MAIKINLTDNVAIELGEMKEELFADVKKDNINYEVMFDKLNKQHVKETIIHVRDLDTEISVINDIVTYARLANNQFTQLDVMSDSSTSMNIAEHISKIKEQINKIFNENEYKVKIEKLDASTMNITIILEAGSDKARAQIVRDTHGKIYISTLMLL
jgi:hypothetical protein